MKCKTKLCKKYLKECFYFLGEHLYWKKRPLHHFKNARSQKSFNSNFSNKRAGSVRSDGYLCVVLDGKRHLVHRVVWVIKKGFNPEFIDHIDGDRLNNQISNLREVSKGQNNQNSSIRTDNKSGIVGVSWYKNYSKWLVKISNTHIGYFDCFFLACCARKSAESKLGYHSNHGKQKWKT
jgi:hypothetical protein